MKKIFLLITALSLSGCATTSGLLPTAGTAAVPQISQQQVLTGSWIALCTKYNQWLISIKPQIPTMPVAQIHKDMTVIAEVSPICTNTAPTNLTQAVATLTAASTTFLILNSLPTTGTAK